MPRSVTQVMCSVPCSLVMRDISLAKAGSSISAPRAVWFQLGIRNDRAAERLAKAGIQVVQDRCIMVDHRLVR